MPTLISYMSIICNKCKNSIQVLDWIDQLDIIELETINTAIENAIADLKL